jgi:hypothetical protein
MNLSGRGRKERICDNSQPERGLVKIKIDCAGISAKYKGRKEHVVKSYVVGAAGAFAFIKMELEASSR